MSYAGGASADTAGQSARIHDRGYRGFTGERTGVSGAIKTLYKFTIARVLGLRRPFRNKLLPILVAIMAYLPAVVLIGLTILIPQLNNEAFPTYSNYYGFIIAAIIVFVAFVAPEALCPDRRNKLLGTYLASPLDRHTYVLAKLAAVTTVICGVTLFPPLLLALGRTFQGIGPSPGDLAVLLIRIVASGLLLALYFAAISLGISSFTDRKAFASAGMILLVIISNSISGAIRRGDSSRDWAVLLSATISPLELVRRIYGETGRWSNVSTLSLSLGVAAWTAAGLGALFWRYRTIEVTR
jgi:ABC-2 type transport system permease protein